jgi:NADH-quinone oxidoreductase subunit C
MHMSDLLNKVEQHLNGHFPNSVLASSMERDFPLFHIDKKDIMAVLTSLKDQMGFKFLTTMCGIHYPEQGNQEFSIMYQLHSLERNERIRLKIFMAKEQMEVPSVTGIFATANWMEREAFDFYGFKFTGHPDLRRILNMDEMNYHPMRKEYALEDSGRDDKHDKYFGR